MPNTKPVQHVARFIEFTTLSSGTFKYEPHPQIVFEYPDKFIFEITDPDEWKEGNETMIFYTADCINVKFY